MTSARSIDCALAALRRRRSTAGLSLARADRRLPATAAQVHALLEQRLAMPCVARHHDSDFLLDLWSATVRLVATHEGLR